MRYPYKAGDIELSLGADPEFFVFDHEIQEFVPAIGLVPGTKQNPHTLDKGSVQVDGTLVEIGVDPAHSRAAFVRNIKTVLRQVREILGDRYELRCGGAVKYSEEVLKNTPPEAFEVGCDPQYRFKTDFTSEHPSLEVVTQTPSTEQGVVFAGGHLHIGVGSGFDITDLSYLWDIRKIVQELHGSGGLPNERLGPSAARRCVCILGMGGGPVIRLKSYGFEYRNPSSFWLCSEQTVKAVADNVFDTLRCKIPLFSQSRYEFEGFGHSSIHLPTDTALFAKKYQGTYPVLK